MAGSLQNWKSNKSLYLTISEVQQTYLYRTILMLKNESTFFLIFFILFERENKYLYRISR